MPQITVKTEWVDKLKALGVYDKWLANVKAQFPIYGNRFTGGYIQSFYELINCPLIWGNTPEGNSFWSKIANSGQTK